MSHQLLGEMFCGPGGIAMGAVLANRSHRGPSRLRHAWAIDYHPDTVETYRLNFGDGGRYSHEFGTRPGCDDIHLADVRDFDLRQTVGHTAFAFGFPCNDFSTVGQHKGLDGDYGALYTYGIHSLALHAPEWFIAENVSGLSRANEGKAFGKILAAMTRPGAAVLNDNSFAAKYPEALASTDPSLQYDLTAHLYRFEEYDVPQRRHRILIVGVRSDVSARLPRGFQVPAPTSADPRLQKTVGDALEKYPIPPGTPNNVPIRHKGLVRERLSRIEPGKSAFNTDWSEYPHLELNVKGVTLSNIYRRLKEDEPAYTVTGSGGGGTHMYHHRELRALTNRERARLQTFPDEFAFVGPQPSVRRQVGMAVPPDGAAMIFGAVLNTLDGIPYKAIEPNIHAQSLINGYRHDRLDLSNALEGDALEVAEESAERRSERRHRED